MNIAANIKQLFMSEKLLRLVTMNIAANIKQLFMSEKLLRLRKPGTTNNPHSPSVDSGLLSTVLNKS